MPTSHTDLITDQFTKQSRVFAAAPELHNDAVLSLVIEASHPKPTDSVLDLACGPGSVALAFAPLVAQVEGTDATPAMLDQARLATAAKGARNVNWRLGDINALPHPDQSFDIVVSRFAMHHFEEPEQAFREMRRVVRNTGRIVVCDAVASHDKAKARAFNEMERFRDPSTVEFRTLDYLWNLFRSHGLQPRVAARFQVPYLAHEFVERAYPLNNDRAGLYALIENSVEFDLLGMNAKRTSAGIQIAFQCVVLVSQ